MSKKMCVNCKYLKDGKYCNRKKSDIYNPKSFCGYWRSKPSVFARITASPEMLAPKFVYYTVNRDQFGTYYWYCSALIPGEKWSEESEAIAATVAKLKGACDE